MRTPDERAPFNVLFLCTGNSARSIMAEVVLNRAGQGKFRAFSAGSQPKGQVHPYALDLLRRMNFDVSGLRSKSWSEFARPDAPKLDFVFTVCDNAAAETCPVWPGQPMTAHWGVPDPAAATGNEAEVRLAFADALRMLSKRILERGGYRVLEASNGDDAERLFAAHGATIDLVVSDVVMPGCGGPELVARLHVQAPALRVLYMSGYAEQSAAHSAGIYRGAPFIEKPFTAAGLLRDVRDALDR